MRACAPALRRLVALALLAAGPAGASSPDDRGRSASSTSPPRPASRVPSPTATPTRKRFIIETNGCGVAMIDLDEDGWVDLVTLNGTQLEPGTRRDRVVAAGRGADDPAVSQRPRTLRRRHGDVRPRQDRLGVERVRRRRRTATAASICSSPTSAATCSIATSGQGRFEDVTAKAGLDGGARSLGLGLFAARLRSRRRPRSVRRQLSVARSGDGAGARAGRELPLEGRAGQLRSEGAARPTPTCSIATTATARSPTSPRRRASRG